jgi:hypothetical protein
MKSELLKVRWINSKTLSQDAGIKRGPSVVHDGMPDGIFYKPTPEVVAEMIKSVEQFAYREWLK